MGMRRKTASFVTASVAVLTATFTLVGAGAANAAEYDYPDAIEPASIVVSTVGDADAVVAGDKVRVDASWSVPDSAVGGETFGFTLPKEFARSGITFSVPATDDPTQTVAECVVSGDAAPVVTCTLTDYVNGRTGVSGSLWFGARADEATSESTVGFVINGTVVPVSVPGGGIGTVNTGTGTALPTTPQKWAWQTDDGRLAWELVIPGASFDGAQSIVIDDSLVPANEEFASHRNEDGAFNVWSADTMDRDPQKITNWTGAWNEEGTAFQLEIAGPIDPERVYLVKYYTVPTAPVNSAKYSNIADINGVVVQQKTTWRVTGGGAGEGTATGLFSLAKSVEGSAAATVPADTTYSVRYSYGDPAVERTLEVSADANPTTVRLPAGTVVTLSELAPPAIDGVDWGTPIFSGAGVTALESGGAQVTIGSGSTLAIVLTNTASSTPVADPAVQADPPAPVEPPVVADPTVEPPLELPLTAERGALASTGGDAPAGMLWIGGAALALGVALTALGAIRARQGQD